jgi:hypothetical protein
MILANLWFYKHIATPGVKAISPAGAFFFDFFPFFIKDS